MRKIFVLIIFILTSCSPSEIDKEKPVPFDTPQKLTSELTKNEIRVYTNNSFNRLIDSLENNSGFLGWKNIRDYSHLGDETMKGKVSRIWSGLYKTDTISKIANRNIENLKIEKKLINYNQKVIIQKTNFIENYSHKIGLSFGLLFIELLISASISSWIFLAIANVIAVTAIPATKKVVIVVLLFISIILFAFFAYSEYKSQKEFELYISEEITNKAMLKIDKIILNIK